MKAVNRKSVLVIGAGVSGLAAAAAFKRQGHDVTIVERGPDLGGVWDPARSYRAVTTQTAKDLYRYTSAPMPASFDEWPSGDQVHEYLTSYSDANGLAECLRLNTDVVSATRLDDDRWSVDLAHDGTMRTETYDFVAVATGQYSEKQMPSYPNQDEFEAAGGRVLHSSEFGDGRMARDAHVVVVGFAKSATDVAVDAARNGAKSVTVLYRRNRWRVPRYVGGLVNFKRLVFPRFMEATHAGWQRSTSERLRQGILKPLIWANWRAFETILKAQLRLKRHDQVPEYPIERAVDCSFAVVTDGWFEEVAVGRIRCVRTSIESYHENSLTTQDGEVRPADVVVLATGWKQQVPFLSQTDQAKLAADDGSVRLHRYAVNPDLPNLGFVGFNSSFATTLTSDVLAHWLVRYADGQLARQPSTEDMDASIEEHMAWRRAMKKMSPELGDRAACTAPFHYRHLDELLADIGPSVSRRNWFAENFTPPDADAYARYLGSARSYQVLGAGSEEVVGDRSA